LGAEGDEVGMFSVVMVIQAPLSPWGTSFRCPL
jgi:hypothetical protein